MSRLLTGFLLAAAAALAMLAVGGAVSLASPPEDVELGPALIVPAGPSDAAPTPTGDMPGPTAAEPGPADPSLVPHRSEVDDEWDDDDDVDLDEPGEDR